MDYLEYKGYKGSVEYSKEDNCLVGKVLGMAKETIIYEGNTIDELRADFEAGIDSYLEFCQIEGIPPRRPFSGKVVLRMTPELHGRVAAVAASIGTSLNDMINRAILRGLDDMALAQ